ncbi:hypothetical protein LTR05_006600 [Lithohypha guttulata]|uniref:Uncharacterized protein n=1 Tax=Lithohypha guttulata TaxID=1690604 RepID=A0AAN7YE04_9EURO|nr:hypothetical protein LTR05_006600 [Lithohypha guttulata]
MSILQAKYPPLRDLRLAEPSDIIRMGTLMYAAFAPEPMFNYLHPKHASVVQYALQFHREYSRAMIENPNTKIVMVIEDKYNPKEENYLKTDISTKDTWSSTQPTPKEGNPVVVGLACWSFTHGRDAPPIGQHQIRAKAFNDDTWPEFGSLQVPGDYDHEEHWKLYETSKDSMRRARIDDCGMTLEMLAATEAGKGVYEKVGCQLLDEFRLIGDEVSPRGASGYLLKYVSKKGQGSDSGGT